MSEYNRERAVQAQKAACEEYETPMFVSDGQCPNCHRNVYDEGGYSVEYASEHVITGCPWCHYSFVE